MKTKFIADAFVDDKLFAAAGEVKNLSESSAARWVRRGKAVIEVDEELEVLLEKIDKGEPVSPTKLENLLEQDNADLGTDSHVDDLTQTVLPDQNISHVANQDSDLSALDGEVANAQVQEDNSSNAKAGKSGKNSKK